MATNTVHLATNSNVSPVGCVETKVKAKTPTGSELTWSQPYSLLCGQSVPMAELQDLPKPPWARKPWFSIISVLCDLRQVTALGLCSPFCMSGESPERTSQAPDPGEPREEVTRGH